MTTPQQRAIEALRKIVKDAFTEGFYSVATYNDSLLNTAEEAWEKEGAGLLQAVDTAIAAVDAATPCTYKCEAWPECGCAELTAQPVEPSRSQRMATAGFKPRDTRIPCDECGKPLSRLAAQLHECEPAEPVQEPVAWGCFKDGVLQTELISTEGDVDFWCSSPDLPGMKKGPLYTAPPTQKRQPLTENQVWEDDEIMSRNCVGGLPMHDLMRIVRAVERVCAKKWGVKL